LAANKRIKAFWATPERISFNLDITQATKFQLLSKHIEPHVLVWSDNWRPKIKQIDSTYFYLLPSVKRWLPFPLLVLYPVIFYPFLFYLIARKRFDVVLVRPGLEGAACALIKRVSKLLGLDFGLLVEAFGDWIEVASIQQNRLIKPFYRYMLKAISKFSIFSADMLRAESSSTMEKMREFAPAIPFSIFPRVHLELFLDLKAESEAKKPEGFNILYVGELIKFKGIHHLISAFKNVIAGYPKASLAIVGEGNYRAELRKMAEQMDILGSIEFTSYLPPGKVKERMLNSDLLVLPSMTEGLPRVIIEAMAVGLPVVATDVGSVKELVIDNQNGYLIKPNDVDSLTKAILTLVGDRDKAIKMGLESRKIIQRAGDLFTMEGYAQRYIDTIQTVYKIARERKTNKAF